MGLYSQAGLIYNLKNTLSPEIKYKDIKNVVVFLASVKSDGEIARLYKSDWYLSKLKGLKKITVEEALKLKKEKNTLFDRQDELLHLYSYIRLWDNNVEKKLIERYKKLKDEIQEQESRNISVRLRAYRRRSVRR